MQPVAAHVQQGPAAGVLPPQPVPGVLRAAEAQVRLRPPRRPDLPAGQHLGDARADRQEPGPQPLHEEQSALTRQLDDVAGLRRGDGQGLLAHHVLPGRKGRGDVLVVLPVRGRDVDDLHLRVRQHPRHPVRPAVGALHPELLGEGARGVLGAGGDPHQAGVGQQGDVRGHLPGDRPRGDDAPAEGAPGGGAGIARARIGRAPLGGWCGLGAHRRLLSPGKSVSAYSAASPGAGVRSPSGPCRRCSRSRSSTRRIFPDTVRGRASANSRRRIRA